MIIVSFGISILVSLISGRKFCGKICP
ncbi:MAG: 4Fe-4S binding protein, partial [Dysgonamonadaceae bacterium]|nr:4Fe-4S binding protein [Dysgonamonadaceae bacterium]